MSDCLDKYMRGWMDDDLDLLLSGCADDFVYDDPYDGRMTKAEFAAYYRGLEEGETEHGAEMAQEADGGATHWIWWAWKPTGATEWAQEGSALTKADADGVHWSGQAYDRGVRLPADRRDERGCGAPERMPRRRGRPAGACCHVWPCNSDSHFIRSPARV